MDEFGTLIVLDAATGAVLGRTPTEGTINALVNDQTDRLYLVSNGGMVQCLHEIGAKEPLYHNPPETASEATEQPAADGTDVTAPAAATQPQPGTEAAPIDDGDPFPDDPESMNDATEVEAENQPADDSVFGGVEENLFGEEP
jgi:hypothetical protein